MLTDATQVTCCFNILGGNEWDSSLRLADYVHALLWLLYQPNLDSRLNGSCPQNTEEYVSLFSICQQKI